MGLVEIIDPHAVQHLVDHQHVTERRFQSCVSISNACIVVLSHTTVVTQPWVNSKCFAQAPGPVEQCYAESLVWLVDTRGNWHLASALLALCMWPCKSQHHTCPPMLWLPTSSVCNIETVLLFNRNLRGRHGCSGVSTSTRCMTSTTGTSEAGLPAVVPARASQWSGVRQVLVRALHNHVDRGRALSPPSSSTSGRS